VIERSELKLSETDYKAAFTEVSFLLGTLVATINQVVGDSTPTLGTSAGRHMARRLPISLAKPTLATVLEALVKQMDAGFEFKFVCDDTGADVTFGRCGLRDVCANRKLELGGDLCKMFHYYHGGMASELLGRPVRETLKSSGASCTARLQV
jgi:hypothetical protein